MELSVVTTLYRSRPFLPRFFEQIIDEIRRNNIIDYEIIIVNDGSPDDSLEYCIEAKKSYPQIRVVDLSRNFGQHYALQAGLQFSSGDYVYMADNDLETPPSFFSDCYKVIKADSSLDLVYGVQIGRKGEFFEKVGGSIFWSVFNKMSDVKIPANALTESIFSRRFLNQLLKLNDANIFLGGMVHWVGFNKKQLAVEKGIREGKSTYSISKRFSLLLHAITSFSGKPLEYLFYFGISVTILSFIFLLIIIIRKIMYGDAVSVGWSSLIGISVMSLGILSTSMGMIGLYIFRIYKQVQGRPNVVVKQII